MKIDFDEEKHEYTVDGKRVPSVSEILAPLSDRYDGLNPSVLQMAAARGTAVHEATEIIDYGGEPEMMPETFGYINAYIEFLRTYFPRWEMIERPVAYYRWAEEAVPFYAGTIDRYGVIDGHTAVVDIKTYASLTTDGLIAASCQTQLYKDAISEYLPIKRYVLHLKKDGGYRLVDLDHFDKERGFDSHTIAWRLFEIWQAKDNAKKTVRKKTDA